MADKSTKLGRIVDHEDLTIGAHGIGESAFHPDSYFALSGHTHSYQPLDSDLTALANLSSSSGLAKKLSDGNWALDTSTYLTGNQIITLTGEASGNGTTSISVVLGTTAVTGKLLTNYLLGTNSAILSSDSILAAFGKVQAQLNSKLSSYTETDPTVPSHVKSILSSDITNWNSKEPAISKSTGYAKWTGSAWSFVNETYSLSTHLHTGVYEPALGNPASNGYILSSTTAGVRSWIAPYSYTLPVATSSILGGVKVGYTTSGKNYKIQLDASSNAYVNVPWTDTVYSLPIATTSVLGGVKIGTNINVDANGVISVTFPSSYVLPTATDAILGGVKLFSSTVQSVVSNSISTVSSRTYGIQLNSSSQAVVNVPWTDTVYTHPSVNHIPTGGSSAQLLQWVSSGTAQWWTPNYLTSSDITNVAYKNIDNAFSATQTINSSLPVFLRSNSLNGGINRIIRGEGRTIASGYMYAGILLSDGNPSGIGIGDSIDKGSICIDTTNGKLYIAQSTATYPSWSEFAQSSSTLQLGETSSTAYRGDRGKIAYDHSQSAHQSILNGTGFVKVSGTTVSYDNTSYLPLAGGTMFNTNLVTNLNADLLDGLHSSSFTKFAGTMLNVNLNDYFGDRREIWDYQHSNGAVTNHPPGAYGYGTMVIEGTPNSTTQIYYSAQQEMFFRAKYNPATAPTWTKVWTDKNLDPSNVNSESLYVNYGGNTLRIAPRSTVCYLQSYVGGFEFSGAGGAAAPMAKFTLVDNDSLFVNSYKVFNAGNANRSDVEWIAQTIRSYNHDTGAILVSHNTSAGSAAQFIIQHSGSDVLIYNNRGSNITFPYTNINVGGSITASNISGANFTPSLTLNQNITSVSATGVSNYSMVNSVVTAKATINCVIPSSGVVCSFYIGLPISTTTGAQANLGYAVVSENTGTGVYTVGEVSYYDTTKALVKFKFSGSAGSTIPVCVFFQYTL